MDARTGADADHPTTWLVVVGPDYPAPGRVLVQAGRLALVVVDEDAASSSDDDAAASDDAAHPDPTAPSPRFNPATYSDADALTAAVTTALAGPLTEAEQAILGLAVSRSRPASSPRVRPHEGLAWDHPGMAPPDGPRS